MKISTWRERLEVMQERSKSKNDGMDCTTRYEEEKAMQDEIDDLRRVLESTIAEIQALPDEIKTLFKVNRMNAKDIVIGKAIVCWGFKSGNLPEAWVLPGGERTMSRDIAETVCKAMNELME